MSEYRLLVADGALPEVARAPAPWTLQGDGWIVLLRLPESVRRDPRHLPPELRDRPLSGPSMVMFVDYTASPAGPYRELLYIPGRFELGDGRRAWSVTRIYVSTWESVVNGRVNWGIPKDRADFHREPFGRGERLSVTVDGHEAAALELAPRGPALPFHAALLPRSLRTLVQHHAERRFELAPGARGHAALGRVQRLASDGSLFPSLADARVLLALRAPRFTLWFPAATSSAGQQPRARRSG
jgi:hypothetical protein